MGVLKQLQRLFLLHIKEDQQFQNKPDALKMTIYSEFHIISEKQRKELKQLVH